MPIWLLTAWPWIKRFGPYVALVVGLLLGWHAVAVHYRAQGRAESAARIAGDEAAIRRGIAAIGLLRGALADQNKAVERLKAEGDIRAREAAAASADALKANASLLKERDTLLAASKRHFSSAEPCTTPVLAPGTKL